MRDHQLRQEEPKDDQIKNNHTHTHKIKCWPEPVNAKIAVSLPIKCNNGNPSGVAATKGNVNSALYGHE